MLRLIWILRALGNMLGFFIFPKCKRFLLSTGELISETRAFRESVNLINSNSECRRLIEENYHGVHLTPQDLILLPEESLGYATGMHFINNNLSIYERKELKNGNPTVYIRERSREFHDIIHTVYQFDVSIPQELGVNAVLAAQCFYPMSLLIIAGGILRTLFKEPSQLPESIHQIQRGWNLGRKSPSVFSIRWENHWLTPLEDLRKRIGIA